MRDILPCLICLVSLEVCFDIPNSMVSGRVSGLVSGIGVLVHLTANSFTCKSL